MHQVQERSLDLVTDCQTCYHCAATSSRNRSICLNKYYHVVSKFRTVVTIPIKHVFAKIRIFKRTFSALRLPISHHKVFSCKCRYAEEKSAFARGILMEGIVYWGHCVWRTLCTVTTKHKRSNWRCIPLQDHVHVRCPNRNKATECEDQRHYRGWNLNTIVSLKDTFPNAAISIFASVLKH